MEASDGELSIFNAVMPASDPSPLVFKMLLDMESSLNPKFTSKCQNHFEQLFYYARQQRLYEILELIKNSPNIQPSGFHGLLSLKKLSLRKCDSSQGLEIGGDVPRDFSSFSDIEGVQNQYVRGPLENSYSTLDQSCFSGRFQTAPGFPHGESQNSNVGR